jgi:DNA-directed RNA polymerase subunit M/transcription elongation factor TFIIS
MKFYLTMKDFTCPKCGDEITSFNTDDLNPMDGYCTLSNECECGSKIVVEVTGHSEVTWEVSE